MQKALIKLKKRRKYKNSHHEFSPFIAQLYEADSLEEITKIANSALAKIIEIENEMKWGNN